MLEIFTLSKSILTFTIKPYSPLDAKQSCVGSQKHAYASLTKFIQALDLIFA